ncbi:zinc finger protein 37 isoform X1 [Bicyclus anynana]|uniref:Zinc finger protein 37 isoform X1 n=1 Tax=Bicyclus anynana TaxID=110368 RepID=A0ABM3M1R3_BICAN|nr:zinc finger protein 37 isoform X1 [Bicyclus anynana]
MYTEVMKVVKTEDSLESLDVDKNMEVKKEYDQLVASHGQLSAPEESKTELESKLLDEALREALRRSQTSSSTDGMPGTHDQLKHENTTFGCTLCLEDFPCEEEYNAHMDMHFQISDADTSCVTSQVCEAGAAVSSGWHSGLIELKHAVQSLDDCHPSTDLASPSVPKSSAHLATKEIKTMKENNQLHDQSSDSNIKSKKDIKIFKNCVVQLCDILKSRKFVNSRNRLVDTASTESHCQTSANDVITTQNKRINISNTLKSETDCLNIQFNSGVLGTNTIKKWFSCDICKVVFKQKKLLREHKKSHAEKATFTCKLCQYKSAYKVPCLAAPLATKEDLPDKTYNNKLDIKLFAHCVVKLYDVLRKPDKLRTSTKSHCETSASDVTGAQKKLMKSYTSQCETHRLCNDNKLQFSKSAVNSLHARNAKRFTCDVCRTTFKQNKFLVQHIKTHTERKMFTCELCQYQSVFKGNVSRHMQTHSRKKPYSCEICEYKSARNCHLQQHMRTHTGERPYSCDICGHASAHKYRLVIHMRSHTGEKRYSCNLCQFKSNRKFNLVQHMRTHTGEKPFSCNFCKYASVRSSHLVQHMRTHTGERRL